MINTSQFDKLDNRYQELRGKIRAIFDKRREAVQVRNMALWQSLRDETVQLESELSCIRVDRDQAFDRLLRKRYRGVS